ncbi:MAG: UDP-3-O-acyl-N-acetylglucosamine deacetylase [Kiritimatiellae bacterium]|nr:UDP-3-O-acyl-N-acetylglucosamine deacetylase [Kiritimatiellia bacterium]
MAESLPGRVLMGNAEDGLRAREEFECQPIDHDYMSESFAGYSSKRRTIAAPMTIAGPGTFLGKAMRTVTLAPFDGDGWWFDRSDLPDCLPTRVSIRNVWTTGDVVSNIVLRSGSPHNYVRMVEHIVALKLGLGIDSLMVSLDSGDPPLFSRGSMDLVETLEGAQIVETDQPATYWTVREPVTCIAPHGGFLTLEPCSGPEPLLRIDCAVNYPNAMGRQRIRFPLCYDLFRHGAQARTNTTAAAKWYCMTIGKLFADVRNLGYNHENVLVAGKKAYLNEPRLVENGKSLEAVWHRSVLDLLAALALVEEGRFVGNVTSYKVGHALDVQAVTLLYIHDLLVPFNPS